MVLTVERLPTWTVGGITIDTARPESPMEQVARHAAHERAEFLRALGPTGAASFLTNWGSYARLKQRFPQQQGVGLDDPQFHASQNWQTWLLLGGRGMGKTRTGAEAVRSMVAELPAGSRIALVAGTAADARDTMVEGESGILAVCLKDPPDSRPIYRPSKRAVVWPNGTRAFLFSAEEPERLRGPQFHFAWLDELAAWKYLQDTYDNLQFGLRLGENPRQVITTTPKPLKMIREMVAEALAGGRKSTVFMNTGSSYENLQNLSRRYRTIIGRYVGTRLGRQEIFAELLTDVPGALWTHATIEETRVRPGDVPDLVRLLTAIDPAVSAEAGSDETGIIRGGVGIDGHAYIFTDATCSLTPAGWARQALDCHFGELDRWGEGDAIVAEVNQGGDLVENTIRTQPRGTRVRYIGVHAAKGKRVRAEPISGFYEQGRVHHVGVFGALEDQLTTFTPDGYQGTGSPDRLDALVWLLTELFPIDDEVEEDERDEIKRMTYHDAE